MVLRKLTPTWLVSQEVKTADSQSADGSSILPRVTIMAPWSSWSKTPPFHGGNAGFKSRRSHNYFCLVVTMKDVKVGDTLTSAHLYIYLGEKGYNKCDVDASNAINLSQEERIEATCFNGDGYYDRRLEKIVVKTNQEVKNCFTCDVVILSLNPLKVRVNSRKIYTFY